MIEVLIWLAILGIGLSVVFVVCVLGYLIWVATGDPSVNGDPERDGGAE